MANHRARWSGGMTSALALFVAAYPASGETPVPLAPSLFSEDEPVRTAPPVVQTVELELPLSLNGLYLGDISTRILTDGGVFVLGDRLRALMADRVEPGVAAMLDRVPTGPVSLTELEALGLVIGYDPAALTLDVRLTPEQRGQTALTLRPAGAPSAELRAGAAEVAVGLSVISRAAYVHESDFEPEGAQPFRADLNGFIALGGFDGWALVAGGDFDAERRDSWRRSAVTLIHDNYDHAVRYRIGDVRPRPEGFQVSPDILGLSVERDYATIQPFRNIQASGRATFTLERSSVVTVEVNGVVTSTLSLSPGRYDVRDFPFTQGANAIRVLVEDEFGVREIAGFSTFADIELLGGGLDQFGVSAGVLRDPFTTQGGYAYTDDPVLTAHYARGLSDAVTVGGELELGPDVAMAGIRAAWGTRFGLVAAQFAVSRRDADRAWAALARYRLPAVEYGTWLHELDAQIEHRQAGFGSLGDIAGAAFDETRIEARYLARQGGRFFGVTASRVESQLRSTFVSLTAGWQWRGWTVSATAQPWVDGLRERPDRFLINITRRLGRKDSMRVRQGTGPYEAEVEVQRFTSRRVGDWGGRAAAGVIDGVRRLDADFIYTAPRAEIDLSHLSESRPDTSRIRRSISEARLGMGFGWADGHAAFGRPFEDGFVIVQPHPALAGRRAVLREGDSGPVAAVSDRWGPGLAPLRRAYQAESFAVEVDDLPPGYDLGSARIDAFGGPRSGFFYRVGSDASNTVMAHLRDASGAAVPLVAGELRSLDRTDAAAAPFFTNRTGRLVAERVAAGRYAVILADGRTAGEIVVPEAALGLVQLPDIVLTGARP